MIKSLELDCVEKLLFSDARIDRAELPLGEVAACYEFLREFAAEKVIYGINTGFGPMAQWRVDDRYLTDLQYNIIRSHSTGAGEPLPDLYVRAAMIARLGTLLQARSGIHPEVVDLLVEFINRGICPFIPEHGSVGASGDLVQLAHIALTLIGEGEVHYRGEWRPAAEVLRENGLAPMRIHIREGLSITNGTSVMTGIGLVNQFHAERLLDWATLASVMMNEIAASYDDFMAEGLNECRRHEGQQVIARRMRALAEGGSRMLRREHDLYGGISSEVKTFDSRRKVQAYYSLRCAPQILGPVHETLQQARRVLEEELNSACDNPIVDPVRRNVFHGGNFHGDYISLEEDKVKIAMVRLAMTAERQLNYLFHDRINETLPPFVNLGKLGLNYGLQAAQFTATSTTAESQTLSNPMYVHSIPNNNDNQDIVSMGTNAAMLTRQVIENGYQVLAIEMLALVQAADYLECAAELSAQTRQLYDDIRRIVPKFIDDTPKYREIAAIENFLKQQA